MVAILRVGDIAIIGLSDGVMPVHPTVVFPDTPTAYWDQYRHRFPESFVDLIQGGRSDRYFNVNIGVFLIRSGTRSVLCDTGLGASSQMLGFPGKEELLDDMKAQGADPGEVETVFLTHLHADHIGWNLSGHGDSTRPTFPRARYRFGKRDWEYFTSPSMLANEDGPTTRERVMPLHGMGLIDLLDGETALAPGVTAIPTPGHTPGHMSLLIASNNERAVILGDLVGSPMQITDAGLPYAGDTDIPLGRKAREQLLDIAERERQIVLGAHLPKPGWGRLIRFEGRRYWQAI
jgi:glyoxylase-like metal-dependent hydrolase (beta-lactamase superfamily II)